MQHQYVTFDKNAPTFLFFKYTALEATEMAHVCKKKERIILLFDCWCLCAKYVATRLYSFFFLHPFYFEQFHTNVCVCVRVLAYQNEHDIEKYTIICYIFRFQSASFHGGIRYIRRIAANSIMYMKTQEDKQVKSKFRMMKFLSSFFKIDKILI